MKLAGDQKPQNTVYFRFLPCPILFGGHELFSGTQPGTLSLLRPIKKQVMTLIKQNVPKSKRPQNEKSSIHSVDGGR